MKTIAFYSYKGGVGRSLAVAHVAYWLSRKGKSVFLLDMDMEAPGLHYKLEQYNHKITPVKGLVDFIGHFNREGKSATSLGEYTIQLKSTENGMSPMWLMPAGDPFSASYWGQLSRIEWKEFLYEGEMLGSLLFLELQAMIRKEYAPDFLLIDSRTGLTDLTGIGMNLLAEDAVILGVNNPENIDGSRIVMERLSRAEKLPFKEAKTRLHFVLTRIPVPDNPFEKEREENLKKSALEQLNAGSGIASGPLVTKVNLIHIDDGQAIQERIRFVEKEWKKYPILKDYQDLVLEVTGLGPEEDADFWEIWNQYIVATEPSEKRNLALKLVGMKSNIPDQEFERGYVAYEFLNDIPLSIEAYSSAIALKPDYAHAYNNRGVAKFDLKQYQEAISDYDQAIASDTGYAFAYNNRGVTKHDLQKYKEAIADYDYAIALDPNDTHVYNNRGNAKRKLGQFESAIGDLEKSLKLDPQYPHAHCTLAEIHSDMGNTDLFYDYFQKALLLDPAQIDELDPETVARHENEERFQALLQKYRPT